MNLVWAKMNYYEMKGGSRGSINMFCPTFYTNLVYDGFCIDNV